MNVMGGAVFKKIVKAKKEHEMNKLIIGGSVVMIGCGMMAMEQPIAKEEEFSVLMDISHDELPRDSAEELLQQTTGFGMEQPIAKEEESPVLMDISHDELPRDSAEELLQQNTGFGMEQPIAKEEESPVLMDILHDELLRDSAEELLQQNTGFGSGCYGMEQPGELSYGTISSKDIDLKNDDIQYKPRGNCWGYYDSYDEAHHIIEFEGNDLERFLQLRGIANAKQNGRFYGKMGGFMGRGVCHQSKKGKRP